MFGCVPNEIKKVNAPPTQNELAHANYGKPITTAEFENAVKATLKDPYSAHVSCDTPKKGWYDLASMGRRYGYFSACKVNAKNGFGAYTGEDVAMYSKGIGANGEYILKNEYLTASMLLGEHAVLHLVE